jgi:ribokinase
VTMSLDATAAGDAFVAALTVAWLEERPMIEALRWARAAGAACAMSAGASASLPDRDDVDRLFQTS